MTSTPFDSGPANPFADNAQAPTQADQPPVQNAPDQTTTQVDQPQTPTQAEQPPVQNATTNPFANISPPQQPPQQAPQNNMQSPLQQQAPAPQKQAPAFNPQHAFGAPVATQQTTSFGGNGGGARKYKIFDLYWIVNQKLYQNVQLNTGEVAVLNISYNIDFDNLRLSFCNPGPGTFTQTAMELKSMERKTTINICAEFAEQLTDLVQVESGQLTNLERVFQHNSNWAPNQTTFSKQNNMITISTTTKDNETLSFTLQEWQIKAFNHACLFLLKEARILTLSKMGIG